MESDSFTNEVDGAIFKAKGHITCTATDFFCLIRPTCWVCGVQYVGETRTSIEKRFCGDRFTVNVSKLDTPVGQHFNLPNHSISDMSLQGSELLGNQQDTVRYSGEKL